MRRNPSREGWKKGWKLDTISEISEIWSDVSALGTRKWFVSILWDPLLHSEISPTQQFIKQVDTWTTGLKIPPKKPVNKTQYKIIKTSSCRPSAEGRQERIICCCSLLWFVLFCFFIWQLLKQKQQKRPIRPQQDRTMTSSTTSKMKIMSFTIYYVIIILLLLLL